MLAIMGLPWSMMTSSNWNIFSALLALWAGNSPANGEFPSQRPVTRSFDVFFDLRLNKRLGKQSWGWLFETPLCSLWRQCNAMITYRQLDPQTVNSRTCNWTSSLPIGKRSDDAEVVSVMFNTFGGLGSYEMYTMQMFFGCLMISTAFALCQTTKRCQD